MNRLLLAIVLLSASGWSQLTVFTNVTAIVRDPSSVIYANGTYNISFISATTGQNFVGLYAVVPAAQSGSLDSFGALSVQVIDNLQISPTGSQWRFSICSASGVTCFATNITISGVSQDISAALQAAAAFLPTSGGGGTTLPGVRVVDGSTYTTIQAAITTASTTGSVLIPSTYSGTDVYTNPNKIQILDLRGKPNRQRGFINVLVDCGLKGDGTTDDATAMQTCLNAFPGWLFWFPPTNTTGACSYMFGATLKPTGAGTTLAGGASGYANGNTTQGGTNLCWSVNVTGIELDLTGQSCSGCNIRELSLYGSASTNHLVTPTLLNMPSGASLPLFTRSIASIQRATNVLTVTVTATNGAGSEALTQQVGSTIKITGVVGDATMNGNCVIATLSGYDSAGGNPTTFTCPQNGSNTGPFTTDGQTLLPTTGASTADGILVCTNFATIIHVVIANFGRHGINADSSSADGNCPSPFSDDLIIRDSVMIGNQADGYLCIGTDCNAHLLSGNAFYYNVMWGIHDESSLGNTHIGNQLSNGGHLWANSQVPATKAISTISRTLTSGISQVSVVLSVADTNLKLGSCVFIAGVTDTSFNTTAGQCFFINSFTDSKHYGYEQPGAPADASSSGGTSRMGTFAEAYLSSGVDDGAQKIETQGGFSPTIINQYVEGGQACKFGPNVITINGANTPPCTGGGTWTGQFITTQGCSGLGGHLCMSPPTFIQNKELTGETEIKAGITTDLQYQFTWLNHSNSRTWIMYGLPSGTLGGSGQWGVQAGSGQTRLLFFGKDTNSGHTYVNAEGPGAVIFGKNQSGTNAGTGGIEVWSGGASPAKVASVDGTGKATFNHGLVIAGSQELTGVQGSTGAKAVAATGAFVSGNCTKTDANGNLVDAAVTCGGTSSPTASFWSACSGAATSSVTRGMPNLGQLASNTCTNAYSSGLEIPVPHSGNLQNLRVVCNTGGVNGSSGVFTVMKNGSTTALTVTIGTSAATIVSDVTHQIAVTAGTDTIGLQFTTQAAETLANCRASFELQ